VYRNRWLDHLVRLMAMTGSPPAFWLGLGVIVLFYGHLQILPGGGGWTTGSTRLHTSPAFI
jgi:peptide/nickel transport system permease protein